MRTFPLAASHVGWGHQATKLQQNYFLPCPTITTEFLPGASGVDILLTTGYGLSRMTNG